MSPNTLSSKEVLTSSREGVGILALKKVANKLSGKEDIAYLNKLSGLRGGLEVSSQIEGVKYLQSKIISVLSKLKKTHPKVNLKRVTPDLLLKSTAVYQLPITAEERIAMVQLKRLMSESGSTTDYLKNSWASMLSSAEVSSKGFTGKILEAYQKDPVGTVALTALGVAGLWLGYEAVKSLFESDKKSSSASSSSKGVLRSKKSKKVLTGLAIMVAGWLFGKHQLNKMLKGMGLGKLQEVHQKLSGLKVSPGQKKKITKLKATVKKEIDKRKKQAVDLGIQTKGTLEKVSTRLSTVDVKRGQELLRVNGLINALVNIYCNDPDQFSPRIRRQIISTTPLLLSVSINKINEVYRQSLSSKKIDESKLGLKLGLKPEILFYVCQVIVKSRRHYEKITKKVSPDQTLKDYLLNLGKDPAIRLTGGVQTSLARAFSNLEVTSLLGGGFAKGISNILSQKPIDKMVSGNLRGYMGHLFDRFGIKLNLDEKEKAVLFTALIDLYATANLNESNAVIKAKLSKFTQSEKVIKAALLFFEKLKNKTKPLLKTLISRYDTKRSDKPDYNEPLKKYLSFGELSVKDGIQMILLGDGLSLNKASSKSMGQAKDLAMIYLVLKILKRNKSKGYAIYAGNMAEVFANSSSNINVSPYLRAVGPYAQVLFKFAKRKAVSEVKKYYTMMMALNGKYTVDQIKKMDGLTFGINGFKQGGLGAIKIPIDLALLIHENFKQAFNEKTTSSDLMKMITAMGGTLFYSQGSKKSVIHLAGHYYFAKPLFEIGPKTLEGLYKGVPIKTYLMGTSTYIAIGVAAAGWGARSQGLLSVSTAMLRGAGRGLAAPVTMPIAGFRKIRSVYRLAKFGLINPARHGFGSLASLDYSMKLFDHYNKLRSTSGASMLDTGLAYLKNSFRQTRKLIYSDIYNKANIHYLKKFAQQFNAFLGVNSADDLSKFSSAALNPTSHPDVSTFVKEMEKIRGFIDELKKEFSVLSNLEGKDFINKVKEIASRVHTDSGQPFLKRVQVDALAHRLEKSPKVIKNLKNWLSTSDDGRFLGGIKSAFGKLSSMKEVTSKVTQNIEDALKVARKNTSELVDKIKETQRLISEAKKAEKTKEVTRFRLTLHRLGIAKEAADDYLKKLSAFDRMKRLGVSDLSKIQSEVSDSLNTFLKASSQLDEVTALSKWLGRLGAGATGLSAIVGAGYVGYGVYQAIDKRHIKGRSALELSHAGLWGLTTAADVAVLTVFFKGAAAGSLAQVGARLALPLAPIAAAGTMMYDGIKDRHLTSAEWSQKYGGNSYHRLIHEFFGSAFVAGASSAREALLNGFWDGDKQTIAYRRKTMNKIFKVLVAMQSDRELMHVMYGSKKPASQKELDKKIDGVIAKKYDKYHQLYFDRQSGSQTAHLSSFSEAKKMVIEATIFSKIMQKRDQLKARGVKSFKIGGTDLMHARYNVSGTKANPKAHLNFSPRILVLKYKESFNKQLASVPIPDFKRNLDKISTGYLVHLYVQINLLKQKGLFSKADDSLKRSIAGFLTIIPDYLAINRHIQLDIAARDPSFYKKADAMSLSDLNSHLSEFGWTNNSAYQKFEKSHSDQNPAVYSLYKLAQYFGYAGHPKELELKRFFSERKATYQGVYWNGSQWVVQEAGMNLDDKMGSKLNSELITKIAQRLKENADDVIENRADSMLASAFDYSEQVKEMANILLKNLNIDNLKIE